MSQKEIDGIVSEFRRTACDISDEEVADVLRLCRRKVEITGQPEVYMKLLLPDELKNHLLRRAVNATTLLRRIGKEVMTDVSVMYADSMSPKMPECCSPGAAVLV